MNIKARINSRKLVFTYFFERYFCETSSSKEVFFDNISKVEKDINYNKVDVAENFKIKETLKNLFSNISIDEDISYLVENVFKKENLDAGIDYDYIKQVLPFYDEYKDFVESKVDDYKKTFEYKEMDLVDRVVFLLGYIEFKKGISPKEVVLNEMIELAKRYGDEGSYRLINGIGHKLLN